MAEKADELKTREEKIAYAKELFGRGSRNYLVKSYAESADNLSEVCEIYADVYGENSDELGMPSLMYGKSLIALAQQGENKLLDVPEEGADDDDDDDDDEEEEEPADEAVDDEDEQTANGTDKKSETNGHHSTGNDEPTAGSSSSNAAPSENTLDDPEQEDDGITANLQVAWEVLEVAVQIFLRQGDSSLANLADAYFELAEISFENSHFDMAVKDYKNSLDIRMKLPEDNLRSIAEIEYKVGLSYFMLGSFETAITSLKKACDVIDSEIETQKSQSVQTDKIIATIKELEELKLDILIKVTEVEETKQQSIDEVKKELANLMNTQPQAASSATPSAAGSSSTTTAEKPNNISHLIKRKKPDTKPDAEEDESSPAKRVDN